MAAIIVFVILLVSLLFVYSLMRAAHDADEQAELIHQNYHREGDSPERNPAKTEVLQ